MKVQNQNSAAAYKAQKSESTKTQSTNKNQKAQNIKTEELGSAQKPEISERAKEAALAKSVATSAPDVREEKIAELKKRIAAKEYNVKPEDIAEKMIAEHKGTQIG